MPINFYPEQGAVLVCDFSGFKSPEMIKRRPVIVISPRFRNRGRLCTIVPLSTTEPRPIEKYHHKLYFNPVLPEPYSSEFKWVKCDMVYTVSFERLSLLFNGKDELGKRIYENHIISTDELLKIQQCVLIALGICSIDKLS